MKTGAVRSDGCVFKGYQTKPSGKVYERWLSAETFHLERIKVAVHQARRRAEKKNLPFDVDAEYLLSIFPSDGICPALNIPMVWGGEDLASSPSLDRRVPELGYVRGNVSFISGRANRIKSDATNEEVLAVAKYLTRILN